MLLDFDIIVKIYAIGLFKEGKKRLRYMLAIAILDIHITYNL